MNRLISLRFLLMLFLLTAWLPNITYADIDPNTVQKLLADDGAASDYFGLSVAVDGDTALIGAFGDGSAYVFIRAADGTWTQQAKLLAADGTVGDQFGRSVSLNGDTALIGAFGDNNYSGSVYVFVRAADGTWTQQAKLLAADGTDWVYFGRSVAVDGDTAIIGAYGDDDKGYYSGSAYVFVRTAGTWTQQAKLLAADGAASDYFGYSVAVDGDTAIIGAHGDNNDSGSAYVFVRAADDTWTQQDKLLVDNGIYWVYFGYSVAVNGDTAIIGTVGDDNSSGSAYVFVRAADDTWTQQDRLLADDRSVGDQFGASVAVDGDTAIIGAYRDDDKGYESGSAYVFIRAADGTWTQQNKLLADDGTDYDYFALSVAIDGDTAVIGAHGDNDKGYLSGSVYVFSSSNTAPVAAAGPDQAAVQGDTVCFDGSGSTDADGDELTYLWTLDVWPAGSSAVLDNPTVDKPCLTADLPGTYTVSLTVNDGTVDSAPSTAEAVVISCQDVAREAVNAVNALDPSVFGNKNNQKNLTKGILEVIALVDQQLYAEALLKLEGGSVLGKTKGCATVGAPDNDDWIKDCASQATVYPLLQQTMVCVQRL